MSCPDQKTLDQIFPPERTEAFFDALYGAAEDGAYDIRLVCEQATPDTAHMAFQLNRRPGKCLKCSLTYGLPEVFQKHPIIAMPDLATKIGKALGWSEDVKWELMATREIDDNQHRVPFLIRKN